MAIGFAVRALAGRARRPKLPPASVPAGLLDFSSTAAGALVALISEDF